jgi:23S rRNA (adenine2503-C2)-methyltransferase
MTPSKTTLIGLTRPELESFAAMLGEPAFRGRQLYSWLYRRRAREFEEMTDLPAALRARLAESASVGGLSSVLRSGPAPDKTVKYLFGLADELRVESVYLPGSPGETVCISSQVGCAMGCTFCATGKMGFFRNLTAGEIVMQVLELERREETRVTNVVFMGMGEPLSNFAAVTHAIRTLNAEWGMGISARRITISTVGLPKAIEKLADEFDLPVTLALSLHAPNDDIRRQLIPWAEYTTIPELLAACQKWFAKTGREITLEYILLGGVNDQPQHARELAEVARTLRANINLIRYNEVKGMPFDRPEDDAVRAFQQILRDRGVNTHIRASRGRDIAAACGQLRHEKRALAAS